MEACHVCWRFFDPPAAGVDDDTKSHLVCSPTCASRYGAYAQYYDHLPCCFSCGAAARRDGTRLGRSDDGAYWCSEKCHEAHAPVMDLFVKMDHMSLDDTTVMHNLYQEHFYPKFAFTDSLGETDVWRVYHTQETADSLKATTWVAAVKNKLVVSPTLCLARDDDDDVILARPRCACPVPSMARSIQVCPVCAGPSMSLVRFVLDVLHQWIDKFRQDRPDKHLHITITDMVSVITSAIPHHEEVVAQLDRLIGLAATVEDAKDEPRCVVEFVELEYRVVTPHWRQSTVIFYADTYQDYACGPFLQHVAGEGVLLGNYDRECKLVLTLGGDVLLVPNENIYDATICYMCHASNPPGGLQKDKSLPAYKCKAACTGERKGQAILSHAAVQKIWTNCRKKAVETDVKLFMVKKSTTKNGGFSFDQKSEDYKAAKEADKTRQGFLRVMIPEAKYDRTDRL